MLPYALLPGIIPGPLFKTRNDNNIVVNDNIDSKFEDLLQLDRDPVDIDYVLYRTEIDSVHPTQTAHISSFSGMLESDVSISVVVACLFVTCFLNLLILTLHLSYFTALYVIVTLKDSVVIFGSIFLHCVSNLEKMLVSVQDNSI